MNRRTFLGTASALALLAAAAVPAAAQTKITGVTYIPPAYEDLAFGYQGFVDRVNAANPEALQIDFYDSGRLVSADEQLPALRSGNIGLMFHTTSYVTRSLPILGITGLPGVVEDLYEHPERIRRGSPLFELIHEELGKQGLEVLTLGGGLMQPEYIWSSKDAPIKSIDDVDGKRIRVVSFEATDVVDDFGGASVRIPSSELYLAMQRGTVDAAVANIATINGRDVDEVTGTVYTLPITAYSIGIFMTTQGWERLSEDEKAAMTEGIEWFDAESAKGANETFYDGQYWPTFREEGIEVIEPDQAAIDRLAEVSKDVRAAWVESVGEEVGNRAIALALGEEQ